MEVLVDRRKNAGFTQEALAASSEIQIDTIRNLEKCETYNPGFFTVADIASALNLRLDRLLVLHEEKTKKRKGRTPRSERKVRRRSGDTSK